MRGEHIQQMHREETAVYDNLEGSSRLFSRSVNLLMKSPEKGINVSFVGASGAGKETAAGQYIYKILHNKKLNKFLSESDRNLDIRYVSLASVMEAAEQLGWVESEWGAFTPNEFMIASILMRDVAGMLNNEQFEDKDDRDSSSNIPVNIFETVAIAKPLNLGASAILHLDGRANHFLHALVRNDQVQEKAKEVRGKLWDDDVSTEQIKESIDAVGSSWDIELTEDKIVPIRKSMGNIFGMERMNELINSAIIEEQQQGNLPDFILQVDKDSLRENPMARTEGEKELLKYFARGKWGVRDANFIVAENELLEEGKVQFYRSMTDKYKVDVIELLGLQPTKRKSTL